MSETVNLFCIICTDEFKGTDEVITTYCGHIFHQSCFQDWQTRSPTCPECRGNYPQTHRVYFHLEDPVNRQLTVQSSVEMENKISQLEHELETAEINFLKIEETNREKCLEIASLKDDIDCEKAQNESLKDELGKLKSRFEESEKNFLTLLEEINKKDEELQENQTEINFLTLKNQNREKIFFELKSHHDQAELDLNSSKQTISILSEDLKQKEEEIQKIQLDMEQFKKECQDNYDDDNANDYDDYDDNDDNDDDAESCCKKKPVSKLGFAEKLRVVNEKYRQISLELDREIGISTALTVKNMKLTKLIDLAASEEDKQKIAHQIYQLPPVNELSLEKA